MFKGETCNTVPKSLVHIKIVFSLIWTLHTWKSCCKYCIISFFFLFSFSMTQRENFYYFTFPAEDKAEQIVTYKITRNLYYNDVNDDTSWMEIYFNVKYFSIFWALKLIYNEINFSRVETNLNLNIFIILLLWYQKSFDFMQKPRIRKKRGFLWILEFNRIWIVFS